MSETMQQQSLEKTNSDPFYEDQRHQTECRQIADMIKPFILNYAQQCNAEDWLIGELEKTQYLENLVSTMRHCPGGQECVLRQILTQKPDMLWYRGGTRVTWNELVAPGARHHFTKEQLATYVLDGGANGVFHRVHLAEGYLTKAKRNNPVVYRIAVSDMVAGLTQGQILLVNDHAYDLRVLPKDRLGFLTFCQNNLHIEERPILPEATKDSL